MSLGGRIKTVRGKLSQKDFGAKFSATPNTIRSYETDSTPPNTDFVLAICEYYRLRSDWLLFGEGPMYRGDNKLTPIDPIEHTQEPQSIKVDENGRVAIPKWDNPDHEMFDYIPMAEAKLSAGGGAFVLSEEIEGYYAFRKSWLSLVTTSSKNLVMMRVTGDSMYPTIQERDTVLIDTGRTYINDGKIYALRVDHTVLIKRLSFRLDGKIMIISDNRKEFDSFEADIKDIHVLGQVIFFSRVLVPE